MNPFNTRAFNLFSEPTKNYNSVRLTSGEELPLMISNSAGDLIASTKQIGFTPICLSGPSLFDVKYDFDAINEQVNVVSGFIQTRQESDLIEGIKFNHSTKWFYAEDTRTNYAIPLGLDVDSLLQRMKRDSKSRTKKLLKQSSRFQVVKSKAKADIEFFSRLYIECANRLGFSANYHFTYDNWHNLLSEDCWNLFILKYENVPVAACITADIFNGIDYTFMAYKQSRLDLSRAMILYLYLELSKYHSGFLSLGGGISEGDPLASFKRSMGGQPQHFRRLKFVDIEELKGSFCVELLKQKMSLKWPV